MKIGRFTCAFALIFSLVSCQLHHSFKSGVTTNLKPWTNLEFYNDQKKFHFAIISDRNGGNRPGIFEDGIIKLNWMQPEFVINIGDLLPGYTTDTDRIKNEWEEVNRVISTLKMPFFYVPGNHDITNDVMRKAWEQRFGRRYYSFVYKEVLFIIMDSTDDHDYNLSEVQKDFVVHTIGENKAVRWTYLFVHHPVWKYNTGGRFEMIEKALKAGKFTVFAGHEHQYHEKERNGSEYYILSTSGGGNSLIGNYMGEFDHITSVTATDQGPVVANLRLDGILPHNISNDRTMEMAKPMLENSEMNGIILCNKGENFLSGTYYLPFTNPTRSDLEVHLKLFYHKMLHIDNPVVDFVVGAGTKKVAEIPFSVSKPISYEGIDPLCYSWELKYNHPDFPGFVMQGKTQTAVKPSRPVYVENDANAFLGKDSIRFHHPFTSLESLFKMNNGAEIKYTTPIIIGEDSQFSFYLRNSRNEFSLEENRIFKKVDYQESTPVVDQKPGFNYQYFEGSWPDFPDYKAIEPKAGGVAGNLMVQDISSRTENWSLVFTGYMLIPADDLYSFRMSAEDGCRLFINDAIVVDKNMLIRGENVGTVALRKGFHKARIEFLEKKSRPRLKFFIKTPGEVEWNPIDAATLFH